MNIVILQGSLSRPAARRTLPSGDSVVTLEVTTRDDDGSAHGVPVAWPDAPAAADDLDTGDEVIVTGHVHRRFFRAASITQSRTEVVADAVVPAGSTARARRAVDRALARVQA